ncbi:hypothetical protein [Caproiciproducens faecalis]|uniref:Uncharacterized protein n=1 Tax=Caproiciproducens faecalis TaxID=2820301 RepID=A0ABS7DMA7_9FIRM|nr:hypothetical protein [Caproiciproducens faecalis]MBW7572439.1 hypothetical protein [Caproiciproducens faecalis]
MNFLDVHKNCLEAIRQNYCNFHFYCERDFVWTVQKYIQNYIGDNRLPYKVFNDFPIESGEKRSKSVDIAVIANNFNDKDILIGKAQAEFVIEFKFEPSKMRKDDICVHKLPVVEWSGVLIDIDRIHRFVENRKAKCGVAILIDEFGRHKTSQHILENSTWIDWGKCNSEQLNVSVLYTEVK